MCMHSTSIFVTLTHMLTTQVADLQQRVQFLQATLQSTVEGSQLQEVQCGELQEAVAVAEESLEQHVARCEELAQELVRDLKHLG